MTSRGGVWISILTVVVLATIIATTSLAGLFYAVLYVLAVTPGVALGRRLVGGWHPAGVLIGAAIGYGVTQLALWLPIYFGAASAAAFLVSWAAVSAVLIGVGRRLQAPLLPLPAATPADLRALGLVLLLVPALMGPPYRNLGAADETGTRYYRAYFTADFVWHTALAAELGRFDTPPRNPYSASEPLHYYWAYFLFPAVIAAESPPPLDDVQDALKANALITGVLLAGLLFTFVRLAVPAPGVAAAAVALALVAASAEGALVLHQIWRTGGALASLTDTNIDAITAWQFGGLRVDGLARGLWYNPQHSFSCALGIVALIIAADRGARASTATIWIAGLALGLSTCVNPFVGAICSAIYGLGIILDAITTPRRLVLVFRHAQAAVPVGLGVGWCLLNGVAGDTGGAVFFGFLGSARNNTATVLLLSLGPLLVLGVAGLWPWRGLPGQPARVAAAGVALSLVVMHFVVLSESSWVSFRTGQIVQLVLPVLVARALWGVWQRSAGAATALMVLALAIGLPTTAIDLYNAQDIGNRREGPGFPWTLGVTPAQQAAFNWIRQHVPPDATVQMEPMLRGRAHWSLIPTFAERRMTTGLPISLIPRPAYEEGSREVQRLFATTDPREARDLARRRGIDYLYVDPDDRAAYPAGVAKFAASEYFRPVFNGRGVTIYEVR